MSLFWGEKEIDQVYWGEKEISQIYWGEKEIWTNGKIIKLPAGTSWDIKQYTSKYKELTVENFYYLSMADVKNVSHSLTNVGEETGYVTIWGWLDKSYDANSGTFSSVHYASGDNRKNANVTPVIVLDKSKLIDLGSKKTFDIKSRFPDKYQTFTSDNFIFSQGHVSSYLYHHFRGYPGTWTVSYNHTIEKSYNQSTGILTLLKRQKADSNVDADDYNDTYAMHAYLLLKAPK